MKQRTASKAQQQKTPETTRHEGVLRRAAVNTTPVNAVPPIVHDVLSSPGQPLDPATREFMEPRFGHDFSQVRVHTDAQAAASAQAVNALGYTVGRDMVFGSGQYAPGTREGKRLLVHELTHVVQQASSLAVGVPTVGEIYINDRSDNFEQAADQTAANVVANLYDSLENAQTTPPSLGTAPLLLQRQVSKPLADKGTTKPNDPHLLLGGKQAAEAVAKILPTANTIIVSSSLGEVELRPGAIWGGDKMLIYATPMTVYYTIGQHLYESSTSNFIRSEWLNALGRGAERAKGMIFLAKVEMTLLEGIFVPWYVLLGVSVAKLGLFYASHKSLVNTAMSKAPTALRLIIDFRQRYPTLFNKMAKTVAKEIWNDLPSGVTAEDVAFFLGRVIHGLVELPEVALGSVMWVIAKIAGLVTLVHLPSIAAHGVEEAAKGRIAELRESMAQVGISLSEEEARVILRELLSRGDTVKKLQELQQAMQDLAPVLKQLADIFRAGD